MKLALVRPFLRRWPGLRLRVKLLVLDLAMDLAAGLADSDQLPARDRMEYGRRVMQLVRWQRRMSALRGRA